MDWDEMAQIKNLPDPDSLAARYLSTFFLGEFVGLIGFCTEKLKIDGTDLQIVACIAHLSSWGPLNEAIEDGRMTEENFSVDQIIHTPINAKSIYLTLGMSRETVRRRLVYLASRGLFERVEGGYIFPVQRGDADFSRDIRRYMLGIAQRSLERFKRHLETEA